MLEGIIIAIVSIFTGICIVTFLYIGVPWVHSRFLRLLLQEKVTKENVLVLTFDDGPSTKLTPAILSILDKHNAKATFFLHGRSIIGREDFVRRIEAEGHEIGSHGFDHLHCWKVSPFRAVADITRGWKTIDAALGTQRKVYPFRPPYGKLNLVCLLYLWLRRAPIVYWTLNCGDTYPQEKRDSQRAAVQVQKARGAVTLAHDFERCDRNVYDMVVESTRSVLSMAKETGMKVVTASELLRSSKK